MSNGYRIHTLSGPAALRWEPVPEPAGDGLVTVEVHAAGVSFADILQISGDYQVTPDVPFTPGMEAAGLVRAAPADSGLEAGMRVAVLMRHGAWQQVLTVPSAQVLPVPDDMSLEAAAGCVLNHLTALHALAHRAQARRGEVLLVHGAGGGVGTAALQVGRALGLRTIGVVSDDAKAAVAAECGADHVVSVDGWRSAVELLVGARRVDVVFDPVAGDRFLDSLRCLAPDGRLLVVGFASGTGIPEVKVNRLLLTNSGVLGSASLEHFQAQPALMSRLWQELLDLRVQGVLPDPPIVTLPAHDARAALERLAARRAVGKLVLTGWTPGANAT